MTDIVTGLADALAADGSYALVTGRSNDLVAPLVTGAAAHVTSPGPTTRLHVGAGLLLGGRRAVVVIDDLAVAVPPDPQVLAVTSSMGCARDALAAGWNLVQPWAPGDVAPLLAAAETPTLVVVADAPALEFDDPADPRRTRLWVDGDLATIVASGAGVPAAVRLAQRLQARGVDIAAVEVAILTSPGQEALVGGQALLVAGRDTVTAFRAAQWPDTPTTVVPLGAREEADLIGAVLAIVPTS